MKKKKGELMRFLAQGGLLIVILDEVVVREYHPGRYSYTSGTKYTVTNYHFLDDQFYWYVNNGTGERARYMSAENPFIDVLKASSVKWTAYVAGTLPHPLDRVEVFARNGANSFVGASVEEGNGDIIFLPNLAELNESSFFEACREYRTRREGTPPPDWVKNISIPGESDAIVAISEVEKNLRELEQQKRNVEGSLTKLLGHKKLLYEKGKSHLEPAVRTALDLVGFATTPSEYIPETQYEIDGRTKQGSIPGILEVKGSKRQIGMDEFSTFLVKLLSDGEKSGFKSKGILLGNALCEESADTRLDHRLFSPHLLQGAKDNSIALINSAELYWLICGILSGEITDLAAIREAILTNSGYVDLRPFCKQSPFNSRVEVK